MDRLRDGEALRCACTTDHCRMSNLVECITRFKCYTQFLPRRDGGDPISSGCISGKTPLLCENRLPAIANRTWPYLVCCDHEHYCNRDSIPTQPAWYRENELKTDFAVSSTTSAPRRIAAEPLGQTLVVAVVVCGIVLLALIIALGLHVLKKQSVSRMSTRGIRASDSV